MLASSSSARLLASATLCALLLSRAAALPCGESCTSHQSSEAHPSVAASASGIAEGTQQQWCTPSFQGAPVLISLASDDDNDSASTSEERWCIPGTNEPQIGAVLEVANASMTTFRFEQTGQADNAFIIKLGAVASNSLILAPNDNGEVALCDISKASSAKFMVSCEECQQPDGSSPKAQSVVGRSCMVKDASSGRYMGESDGKLSLHASQGGQQDSKHWKRCDGANADKTKTKGKRGGDTQQYGGCYSGQNEGKDENEPALFDIVVAGGQEW